MRESKWLGQTLNHKFKGDIRSRVKKDMSEKYGLRIIYKSSEELRLSIDIPVIATMMVVNEYGEVVSDDEEE